MREKVRDESFLAFFYVFVCDNIKIMFIFVAKFIF